MMAHSRRGFIRVGAAVMPGLVCTVFSMDAQATTAFPSDPTTVDRGLLDVQGRGQPMCACPRCAAGNPPAEHLF